MQEKAMVSDALNSINADLKALADMISQTENQELRSTLQQMRNEAEKSQYELYNIAKNLNYYQPAQKASQDEINRIKNTFSQSSGMSGSSSGMGGMTSGMGGSSGMSGSSSGMSGMTSGMGGSSGMSGSSSGMGGMGGSSGMSGS
ncbi:MAG: spore coat protein, partial [Clostridiales bacterium]|nr:spore coat protein [Clostridiales bacterium]